MSNEHSKPAPKGLSSYPLIGREHLTKDQAADFLKQARLDEKNYGPKDYQHKDDIENLFRNPNHPVNLKSDITKNLIAIRLQTEHLETYSRLGISDGLLLASHKNALQNSQILLSEAQDKLEDYYEKNPHKRPDAIVVSTVESPHADSVDVKKQGQGWHKQRVDATQPLQFTEAFRRTAQLGTEGSTGGKSTEFRPYVAQPDARALYTNSGETDPNIAWHKQSQNFSHHQPISNASLKKTSKLFIAGMGLLTAAEVANATPGTISEKLTAAGNVLKDTVLSAIPGVTYVQKMQVGKYEEAALDAASYLPLGDVSIMARSPEEQAVIDALPKTRKELQLMMQNNAETPINRHLAEHQLMLTEAKNTGELFKGLSFSSGLTELADKKIALQTQWAKNAEVFSSAIRDPNTDWGQIIKNNPEIAPQVTIHLAAVQSDRPSAFVAQIDANLSESLAKGTLPKLPAMAADVNQIAQEDVLSMK